MAETPFATCMVAWQQLHGRNDLPWQVSDPYRVWLSEIMLQQTQVATVLEYYRRFLVAFPTLPALAAAAQSDVLACWSGLGYYSRARNLHKAAQWVMHECGGVFPDQRQAIEALPGVGRSTAAAIAAFAFGRREAILDGNVKRVLTRCFGIEGFPGERRVEQQLWNLAESLLPNEGIVAYTQGLMDLGATVCTRGQPACAVCPVLSRCVAAREGRVGELPTPRPRKSIPTRHTVMMLARSGMSVWLERRPPSGIWGGLLSLPEFDDSSAVADWLTAHGQGDVLPAWDDFEHVFSHYRLIITPLPLRLDRLDDDVACEGAGGWVALDEAPDAGVPAPVRKLLLKLARSSGTGREN